MSPRALVYLHPLAALAALGLAVYTGSLGLRSRSPRRDREELRRRHARLGPWLWALVIVNWAAGLATVWWLRDELEPAASGHFTLGTAIVALYSAAAAVSRLVPTDARARAVHPVLGAAATLLAGVQVFLGLQLLP
jgi:hypothetical protein